MVFDMKTGYSNAVTHLDKNSKLMRDSKMWNNTEPILPSDGLTWFSDGSKTVDSTAAGIYGKKSKG